MKKSLLLIVFLSFAYGLMAQEESTEERSSITYDGASYNFTFSWQKNERMRMNTHLPGIGFWFSNFDGLDDVPLANLKASRSYTVGLALGDLTTYVANHWTIGLGVRLDFSRYHFKGDVGLQEFDPGPGQKGYTDFVYDPHYRYKSSKLIMYYVTIPLVLEYQTKVNGHKVFFMNAGVEGLIKYYSKSQIDVRREHNVDKITLGKDLNLLPVNARFVFNIGIEDVGLMAYYQPFSIFQKDKGPDLKAWGVGIGYNF